MSVLSRAIGVARSLAVYHGIPGRQRRMRRLYRQFVSRGDIVFDIGAHVGNRTRALAALGCRVISLEPQPDCARLLRAIFARSAGVTVVEVAVGSSPGRADLALSDRTPTVTTLSPSWRAARRADQDFAGVEWNRTIEVPVTTVDALIERFGMPAFVKIDVEGAEPDALAGLSHRVPVLSFEYLPNALDLVAACTKRLLELGDYRFTWSPGESFRLATSACLTASELITCLATPGARRRSGDVYAVLNAPDRRFKPETTGRS